jgi:hypothetical protein
MQEKNQDRDNFLGRLEEERDVALNENIELAKENLALKEQQEALKSDEKLGEDIIAKLQKNIGKRVINAHEEMATKIIEENMETIKRLPNLYKTIIKGLVVKINVLYAITKLNDDIPYINNAEISEGYKTILNEAMSQLSNQDLVAPTVSSRQELEDMSAELNKHSVSLNKFD